jgi:NADPH-dependent 2,4-dienoyl-CoA reductase/sulfur reductase-like enzyme
LNTIRRTAARNPSSVRLSAKAVDQSLNKAKYLGCSYIKLGSYMDSRIRLVVIGGGIAGAELVRTASSKKALDITLIDPKPRLEVQALYPEYLVGKAKVEDMTAPHYPFCQRVGPTS